MAKSGKQMVAEHRARRKQMLVDLSDEIGAEALADGFTVKVVTEDGRTRVDFSFTQDVETRVQLWAASRGQDIDTLLWGLITDARKRVRRSIVN